MGSKSYSIVLPGLLPAVFYLRELLLLLPTPLLLWCPTLVPSHPQSSVSCAGGWLGSVPWQAAAGFSAHRFQLLVPLLVAFTWLACCHCQPIAAAACSFSSSSPILPLSPPLMISPPGAAATLLPRGASARSCPNLPLLALLLGRLAGVRAAGSCAPQGSFLLPR